MKSEQKIFLDVSDDAKAAVHGIIQSSGRRVILNIPKRSVLGKHPENFLLLKRECETAGKKLRIESVDDHILELAASAGIDAINPVFQTKEKIVTDIVPKTAFHKHISPEPEYVGREDGEERELGAEEENAEEDEDGDEKDSKEEKIENESEYGEGQAFTYQKSRRSGKKKVIIAFLVIFFLAGISWALAVLLPHANIAITLKKTVVPFEERVRVTVDGVTERKSAKREFISVPGELVLDRKNLEKRFPASGKEIVNEKAKGTITVYNAYSSAPQVLVARTRFETPDGKTFLLDERVTVPGAKIENGRIVPTGIEVKVTAKEPGEAYNIGPVKRFTIPGFRDPALRAGFYGVSTEPMRGGFTGEKHVPTAEDIEAAKENVRNALRDSLEASVSFLTEKFFSFDQSSLFRVTREDIDRVADADGNFGVFMEAELKRLVFDEGKMKEAIAEKILSSLEAPESTLRMRHMETSYEDVSADFEDATLTFSVKGEAVFEPDIDAALLKERFLGLSENQFSDAAGFLPAIQKMDISLSPFWVRRIPKDPSKVTLVID